LQVVESAAATVTVRQFVTCREIDDTRSPYEPVDVTDVFFTSQGKVWALLVVDNVQPPASVSIAYYVPEGREYGRATKDFDARTVSYAVFLEISEAERYMGLWRVEAYVEGTLVSTTYFELRPPGPYLRFVDAGYEPGAGVPLYVDDLARAAYRLQNAGVTTASNVEVRVVDSPPEVVVVESAKASDLTAGSTGTWRVVMRPQTAGTFRVVLNVFMNNVKQVFRHPGKSETFDRFTITLTVDLKPPFLVVQRIVTQPNASEPFYVGDVGTITYVVKNSGQTVGEYVEIRVASAPAEIEILELTAPRDLQPGATDEWQVKLKAKKPGTYEVYVSFYIDGQKVIFQVEGESETIERFKTTITANERPLLETYGLYIGVGLVALVAIFVAVMLVMRRKARAAAYPPPAGPPMAAPAITPPAAAPEGKFCINCGSQIPQASTFCPRCGAQQQQAS